MQQIYGTGRHSESKQAIIRDRERHIVTSWTGETVSDSQQPWETFRDIQQLHRIIETVRDSQQP